MTSSIQRPFTIDTAELGLAMTSVHVDQAIACEPAEPEVKGEGGLVEVIGKTI